MTSDLLNPTTLAVLRNTPMALRAFTSGVPEEVLRFAPAEGEWSIHDVVAHLLDRHRIQVGRVRSVVEEDRPAIPDVPEQESLEASGLRSESLLANLAAFAAERAADVPWLASLDAAALARVGVHSVAGEISAANLINHQAHHDAQHLGQIAHLLELATSAGRGNLAVF